MTNLQLAQAWANREKDSGIGSNLFFVGNIIYSYGSHYVAGMLVPEKKVVIINKRKRSASTSRHTNLITEVTKSKGYRQLYAYYPEDPNKNANNSIRELFDMLALTNKLNKRSRTKIIEEIKSTLIELEQYNDTVCYEPSKIQRDAIEEIEKVLEDERVLRCIKAFQNYEIDIFQSPNPALRISKDGNYIETSSGAKVPLKDAKKAFLMLKSVPPEELPGKYIGQHKIVSLSGGVLKIGCHKIPMEDIEKIGDKIEKISYTPA